MRFVRLEAGVGREVVEAEVETPLGREAFQAPNTVSRALFALSLSEDDGGVVITCLADTSRLTVAGKPLSAMGQQYPLQEGDVVCLLRQQLRYRFHCDMPLSAPAPPKRTKTESAAPVAFAAVPAPQPAPPVRAASGRGSGGGFVASAFKFYRNPVLVAGHDNYNCLDLRPFFAEPGIERVCLTSYDLDSAWLLSAFPVLLHVPVAVSCPNRPVPCPANWRHAAPQTLQYGTVHGKLMLLWFAHKLRVIITTANHSESDHLFKSNGVWTQEFPALSPAAAAAAADWSIGYRKDRNDFGPVLQDYLRRSEVTEPYFNLRAFDFSGAAVALVTSVSGIHRGASLGHYGYARLAEVLKSEGIVPTAKGAVQPPLIMQCSSLGKMSKNYIASLTEALGGGEAQLVWPSAEFVRTSIAGWAAGGSLCLNNKTVDATVKQLMRLKYEGVPERRYVSPHIKTMFRMAPGGSESRELQWLYVGSHNLSKSSWGELQNGMGGKQMRVASFEIGVVFIPRLVSQCAGSQIRLVLGRGNDSDARVAGEIVLPIPYRYPCSEYSASHSGQDRLDDMPWMWDVSYAVPDLRGKKWNGLN